MSWLIEALTPLVPYGLVRRRRVRARQVQKARSGWQDRRSHENLAETVPAAFICLR